MLALAPAACSAGGVDGSRPETTSSPIIGGARDTSDHAVVMLVDYPADESAFYSCTASFISPTVLLTAAHCGLTEAGFQFGVFLGDDASPYNTGSPASTIAALKPHLLTVKEVHANPAYAANAQNYPGDIGIVILDAPVSSVTPLPINRAPLTAAIVGRSAEIVGYGQVVYRQFNLTEYSASTKVASLDPDGHTVVVGDANTHTCLGDSGGPAIVTMAGVPTIIGTDSFTQSNGCTEPSHFQRTDVYSAFIDGYLNAPPADGGSGGSSGSSGGSGDGGGGSSGGNVDAGSSTGGTGEIDSGTSSDGGPLGASAGSSGGGSGRGGGDASENQGAGDDFGSSGGSGCAVGAEGTLRGAPAATLVTWLLVLARLRRRFRATPARDKLAGPLWPEWLQPRFFWHSRLSRSPSTAVSARE
jgi:V8-like Glu-specific endopeptidase